ncbi:hypothetical protein BKA80DRAFT_286033 [Phyllosticta citrichinensis]
MVHNRRLPRDEERVRILGHRVHARIPRFDVDCHFGELHRQDVLHGQPRAGMDDAGLRLGDEASRQRVREWGHVGCRCRTVVSYISS